MEKKPEIITDPISTDDVSQLENIMLLFFAYKDFVGDADRLLEELEFGRAHHRVMFFVNKKPGLSVAELLEILGITKQSLARVLRQLVDHGYIYQRMGENDRRKRLLYPTDICRDLVLELSALQALRIESALSALQADERDCITKFMQSMIDAKGRRNLASLG